MKKLKLLENPHLNYKHQKFAQGLPDVVSLLVFFISGYLFYEFWPRTSLVVKLLGAIVFILWLLFQVTLTSKTEKLYDEDNKGFFFWETENREVVRYVKIVSDEIAAALDLYKDEHQFLKNFLLYNVCDYIYVLEKGRERFDQFDTDELFSFIKKSSHPRFFCYDVLLHAELRARAWFDTDRILPAVDYVLSVYQKNANLEHSYNGYRDRVSHFPLRYYHEESEITDNQLKEKLPNIRDKIPESLQKYTCPPLILSRRFDRNNL